MARIALITCREPGEKVRDEMPTVEALQALGHEVEVRSWDDTASEDHAVSVDQGVDGGGADGWPDPGLQGFDIALPRSTWNYHLHPEGFLRWIDRAAQQTEVWNRPAAIRGNHHKRYLTALAERGVRTVPTFLVPQGSGVSLDAIRDAKGWGGVVVKPAVGASSYATRAFPETNSDLDLGAEAFFREAVAARDTLVQPLLREFELGMERSIIWIDGQVTHVVSRSFRPEGEEDVAALAEGPTEAERLLVAQCLSPLMGLLMYARVDVIPGPDGAPRVSELELIEPSLYLDLAPEAAASFAQAVEKRVRRSARGEQPAVAPQ